MWKAFAAGLGASTILLAAVAWLIRSIVSHFLSKDVATYRVELKAQSDRSLEEFRATLQERATEHQILFSRLHDKRASIIAELYAKLAETISATESFVSPAEWVGEPDKKEKYKKAMELIVDFFCYFDRRRIFLEKPLCDRVDAILDAIRSPAVEFFCYLDEPDFDPTLAKQKRDVWIKAWRAVKKEVVPAARQSLEDEFRQLLGATKS